MRTLNDPARSHRQALRNLTPLRLRTPVRRMTNHPKGKLNHPSRWELKTNPIPRVRKHTFQDHRRISLYRRRNQRRNKRTQRYLEHTHQYSKSRGLQTQEAGTSIVAVAGLAPEKQNHPWAYLRRNISIQLLRRKKPGDFSHPHPSSNGKRNKEANYWLTRPRRQEQSGA